MFQVRDTGRGIAPEQLAVVFRPFAQLGPVDGRKTGNTGLGLTIAKYLTELMGGTIDLASEVGVGTTFTVRLPLAGAA